MDKKYAILDMDGTLVDSMKLWNCIGHEYLLDKGVKNIPNQLDDILIPMTMYEVAEYIVEKYMPHMTPETVMTEMNNIMYGHYITDVQLKGGALPYVLKLREQGVRLCVASNTDEALVRTCLKRLKMDQYLEFIISCENVGKNKSHPDVYLFAAQCFGAKPCDVAVYEDAAFAARCAKNAGFYVVGVYEKENLDSWEKVKEIADETVSFY